MKSISYSVKKKVVSEFYNILKINLKYSYLELDSFHLLSKRKIYKLLKLSYQSQGIDYKKQILKDMSLILSCKYFDNLSKSDVKHIYNFLLKKDIYQFVKLTIGNIYLAMFSLMEFKVNWSDKLSSFIFKIFNTMRILTI